MKNWLLWTILLPIILSVFLRPLLWIPRSSLWLWIFSLQIIFLLFYVFRLKRKRSSADLSNEVWVRWTIFYPILITSLLGRLLRLSQWIVSFLFFFLEVVFWLFYIFRSRKKAAIIDIKECGEEEVAKDSKSFRKWKSYGPVFVFVVIVCIFLIVSLNEFQKNMNDQNYQSRAVSQLVQSLDDDPMRNLTGDNEKIKDFLNWYIPTSAREEMIQTVWKDILELKNIYEKKKSELGILEVSAVKDLTNKKILNNIIASWKKYKEIEDRFYEEMVSLYEKKKGLFYSDQDLSSMGARQLLKESRNCRTTLADNMIKLYKTYVDMNGWLIYADGMIYPSKESDYTKLTNAIGQYERDMQKYLQCEENIQKELANQRKYMKEQAQEYVLEKYSQYLWGKSLWIQY